MLRLRCTWLCGSATVWLLLTGCGNPQGSVTHAAGTAPPREVEAAKHARELRLTGTVQAVHYFTVQVPQIAAAPGQGGGNRLTLTRIVAGGTAVQKGDIIAEFDRTTQLDNAREAQAKYDDLSHQVEQRAAQNRADAAKRAADLQKAEADLAKAEIQLKKGPLLSEIDRLKNEVKLADAREHVSSLNKSNAAHDRADAAALRVLELQRDRQKVSLDRALRNADRLQIKAPLAGMVALENVWRNNSMGHPQEGDQLWGGQPLVRIFDPGEMEVRVMVGEPDDTALMPGAHGQVKLDAYPELTFPAHFVSASPVAASALGSPIKNFSARFRLESSDAHLLPDLSAVVVIAREAK